MDVKCINYSNEQSAITAECPALGHLGAEWSSVQYYMEVHGTSLIWMHPTCCRDMLKHWLHWWNAK